MHENDSPVVVVGKAVPGDRNEQWSHEDKEAAFWIYADLAQGNRSFRRTAKLTGIPFQTLSRWNATEGWQARLFEQDERHADLVKRSVMMRLVNGLDGAMDTLMELVDHGTNHDKVRLDAVKLALGIASFSEVRKLEADIITNDVTAPKQEKTATALSSAGSVAELSERLNEKLKALSAPKVEEG